jgi:hypothetical protein
MTLFEFAEPTPTPSRLIDDIVGSLRDVPDKSLLGRVMTNPECHLFLPLQPRRSAYLTSALGKLSINHHEAVSCH